MSINAYRMKRNIIELESATFDLGHDDKFTDFLNKEMQFCMSLNSYGTGIVDVPIDLLEEAMNIAKELALDNDTVEQIRLDIQFAKLNKDEIVTYSCF